MHSKSWIGVLIALALGATAGWLLHGALSQPGHEEEGEEHAVAPGELQVQVKLGKVERTDFATTVDALGRVQATPASRWRIASRASGRVTAIGTRSGARVARGDLLVSFDPAPFDRAITEAEAALSTALAEQSAYQRSGAELARARLLSAVEQAKRELETAEREATRIAKLVPDGLVSERAVLDARDTRARRALELDVAQREFDQFESGGHLAESARIDAQRDAAAAKLAEAQALRAECDVRAPQDAVVLTFEARPGQVVDAGADLGTLLVDDHVTLEFDLTPRDAGRIADAAHVTFTLDDGSEGAGTLLSLSRHAEADTGMLVALVEPSTDVAKLREGMLLRGTFEAERLQAVLVVPAAAVVRVDDEPAVFRVGGDHIAHRVAVRVLARHGDRIAVAVDADALHERDDVVQQGAHNLPDGARVTEDAEKSGH
ncbi:MAG: HlyD family efflux transporter periplasmic adaptor subunit [Planctomycetota bacterium]